MVVIAPYVLHRHRRLWHAPDCFDPHRFLGEARSQIDRFAYLPLGVDKLLDNFNAAHTADKFGQQGRVVTHAGADLQYQTSGSSASRSVISAVMKGCEIVLLKPIGSGVSS